jgi:hypothetical protein
LQFERVERGRHVVVDHHSGRLWAGGWGKSWWLPIS